MRAKTAAVFIFIFSGVANLHAVNSPFRGISYSQHGILVIGENSMPIDAHVKFFNDNSTALQLETTGKTVAKLKLDPSGNILLSSGSPPFGELFANKFVLPVFKAILLFDTSYSRAYFDSKWQIVNIAAPRFNVKFEDYSAKGNSLALPRVIRAEGKSFLLRLELIEVKKN